MDPKWLDWTRRLQAIAQNGLAYANNPYDVERYETLRSIAAEMTGAYSDAAPEHIRGLLSGEEGYATPKVDVRGVVFRDDAVLLVREVADGGRWTLPGGWADVGDSPSEAVEREVFEESGYRVKARKLLALYDKRKHSHPPDRLHIYKAFFLCELLGGTAAVSAETAGAEFFREDRIPVSELSLGRTTPEQLARIFEHLRHPEWPADFD